MIGKGARVALKERGDSRRPHHGGKSKGSSKMVERGKGKGLEGGRASSVLGMTGSDSSNRLKNWEGMGGPS